MKRRKFIKQASATAMLAPTLPLHSMFNPVPIKGSEVGHICIFSKHLHWLNYRDMASLAAEIGFSGIDLTVRKGGHVLPERVRTDLPIAVKEIRAAGLEVPMITTGITDPGDPVTLDILETAGQLGIKLYRTGWFRYKSGIKVADQLETAARQLAGLQKINEANHIASSYQNHAGAFIGGSGWDLLKIIKDLDPRWTGVQFDIRHAMVEGPQSWSYILELLAPYINSLDIKDYTWETGEEARVKNVPLGEGMVDFQAYIQKLSEFQIRADASIHYEYPMGGAEHGGTTLGISKEKFVQMVGSDLSYFKEVLVH